MSNFLILYSTWLLYKIMHKIVFFNLAPCDFWLFPKLKELLAGNKYTRVQDLSKAVNSELRGIPKEEYRAAFDKWRRRLQLCIQRGGEYFEGL